jgi:hypothetical protein
LKRKLAVAAGLVILLSIGTLLLSRERASGPTGPGARSSPSFELGIPTAQEVRNMLAVYGERVEATEKEVAGLRADLAETRKRLEESREKQASGLEKLLAEIQGTAKPEPAAAGPPRFRTVEFEKPRGPWLHVPAGSFGEATLLSGVFAPVSGEALPVLLRLDAALVGPQRSRVPIRDAFLVGKAQGDANSRRATVQLETLSLLRPDGSAFEAKVNGWTVDEDGAQGLRGEYVWRADEIAVLASVTGAFSAGSEALAQGETTVQATPLGGFQGAVTGNPFKYAGHRALSSAFARLGEVVSQRLNEIVPAIHVTNGRRVTVAFIGGVTLEGYERPAPAPPPHAAVDRKEW